MVITICGPSPSQCLDFYGRCLDETVRNILGPLRDWEGPASQDIQQSKRKNEIEWVKKDKLGHDWQPIEPSFNSIALTAPDPCTHTQLQGATVFIIFIAFYGTFLLSPSNPNGFHPDMQRRLQWLGVCCFLLSLLWWPRQAAEHPSVTLLHLDDIKCNMADTVRGLALWPRRLATSERLAA